MVHLRISRGLNLPQPGAPAGEEITAAPSRTRVLDFRPFQRSVRPTLLVRPTDRVRLGQPLVHEASSGRVWVSPASGTVVEIVRGAKRILEAVRVEADPSSDLHEVTASDPITLLTQAGLLSHIRMRPFDLPAHPHLRPRSIFVRGLESAPYVPSAEQQVAGREAWFQAGLNLLSQVAPVHLVTRPDSQLPRGNVSHHTAEGPHPIANASVHIEAIDPIIKGTDIVWTVDVLGVLAIGRQCLEGRSDVDRLVAWAGEGIAASERRFVRMVPGAEVPSHLISGDPLTGRLSNGFLGWGHTVVCAFPEAPKRRFLHFFRLSAPYTAGNTYRSRPHFSNLTHGEERPFIDPNIYDAVMPLRVPTVPFLKALITEQYELAERLGLFEVAPEDFALPAFVCPSKIDMVTIVENGLLAHAKELLSLG